MISDEGLMLQFQQGSREAFDELFARYHQLLFGFFRRRLPGRECAEDLAQETFMAVIRGRERYEPRALVKTYLFGIAMRLLYAERRRQVRESPPDGRPVPAAGESAESSIWIREAVTRLVPMDREVLLLREYEEFSYAEIAELLDIPLNTVRSRLFRAREALREQLLGRCTGTEA